MAARASAEAISKALAAEGASVVVTDITLDAATRVVDEIAAAGGTAAAFAGNTAVAADSEKAVDFAVATYGALHLAVNNAGIGAAPARIGDYDVAAWDRVVGVDLSGVFYGLRYQLPALVAAGGGAIVNMSSVLGSVGIAQNAAYVASKHALVGLTKVAALEYSAAGRPHERGRPRLHRHPARPRRRSTPTRSRASRRSTPPAASARPTRSPRWCCSS